MVLRLDMGLSPVSVLELPKKSVVFEWGAVFESVLGHVSELYL